MTQTDLPSPSVSPATATVYIVDDDDAMRQGTHFLLRSAGLNARCFSSAAEFLDIAQPGMRGCVLLDIRMPGMSGLELQEELRRRQIRMPIILVTGHASVPVAVRAMRAGAFDFVEKPFEGPVLLDRVRSAIAADNEAHGDEDRLRELNRRLDRLTPREREVMELVVEGMLNKQIAASLDISMKTVENHRAHVMEKLGAQSLADLVRMAVALGF